MSEATSPLAATETVAASSPAAGGQSPWYELPDPRRWVALASVFTGLFMVLLDVSIVAVAIPAIRTNLGANDADIQFVVAGYSLAYGVMLITGGRLGDIFGRKRLFMLGMAGFVTASALCGAAQSALMLDLSRVLQGLMAALMYPQVLSIVQVTFPPRERARVFGLLGAVIGLATVAGPLVGGLIIRNDLTGGSWRWIFLVNLPIGIVSLIVASRVVRDSRAPNASRLDMVGMTIATLALVLLVYPLVEGQVAGWPAWTYISMGLSPFVLALFVLYERSLPASRFPLVQLSLFRIRSFSVGVVIAMVFLAGVPAFFFTFSLMMQVGLGWSALHAGLTTIPWSAAAAFASIMSTRLAPRLGRVIITIGCGLLVAAMLGLILTVHLRGVALTSWDLVPTFLVAGLGMGTVVAPLLNILLAGVPPRDAGSAAGVLTTFQQLGGAIGVAVVGVVFFGLLTSRAPSSISLVTPQLSAQLARADLPAPAVTAAVGRFTGCFETQAASSNPQQAPPGCGGGSGPAVAAFRIAGEQATALDFVSSMERALFLMAGFWTLAGILSLLLPRVSLPGSRGAPSGH